MAVTQTARLGVYRWSGGADPFTRQQVDASHSNLEDRAAIFLSGTTASRPAASASNVRGFFLDTTTNILYYCAPDGASFRWVSVTAFAAPIGTLTPGITASAGTAETAARSDHTHTMLPFAGTSGAGAIAQVGTATSGGSGLTYAAGDHVHVLANGAVTAGKIAVAGISASNQFASGVVNTAAIGVGQVTRDRIAASERIPVGTLMPWMGIGTTAPVGWVLCDGQSTVAIDSDLGVVLGTRFNIAGDATSVARVPDLRGRFVRGAVATTSTGASTGADSVTLAVNQLPEHTHAAGSITVATHEAHQHGSGTLAAVAASTEHQHGIDHNHGTVGTAGAGTHSHNGRFLVGSGQSGTNSGNWDMGRPYFNTNGNSNFQTVASGDGTHSHTVTIPPIGGLSGFQNANTSHPHTISGSTGNPTSGGVSTALSHSVSGTTGAVVDRGTQSPVSTVPSSITVNYIIKS